MPYVATWMQLEIIILSEVRQKEKDKYISHDMWSLKDDINMSIKQKQTHRHREQTCSGQGARREGRDGLGVWD